MVMESFLGGGTICRHGDGGISAGAKKWVKGIKMALSIYRTDYPLCSRSRTIASYLFGRYVQSILTNLDVTCNLVTLPLLISFLYATIFTCYDATMIAR
jgi:hypothetical protein